MLPSQQNFLKEFSSLSVFIYSLLIFLLHPCHLYLQLLHSPKLHLLGSQEPHIAKSNGQSLTLILPASQKHWEAHDLLPSLFPSLYPSLLPFILPKTHFPEYRVLLMLLLPWLLLLISLAAPSSLALPLGLGYQDCSRFSASSPSIQLHIHLQPHSFKYYLCAHVSQF